MTSRVSFIVSIVTELMTMRISGFFERRHWTICFRLPDEPPMNAWVGSGRSFNASGANPRTTFTFGVLNFSLFCSIRSAAASSFSIEYMLPSTATRAISMETDPVPAPTSYTIESLLSLSFATDRVLTSDLVMGASPRMNSSSGMLKGFVMSGSSLNTIATQRSPNSIRRSSAGVPRTTFSVG